MNDWEIERALQLSSPKVLAMYEAVNELMEEGQDIYSMKISEITARAGIGKGTAYEYFSAKEELLGKAIFYQLHQGLMQMTERAMKQDSFRKQIYAVLEEVEHNYLKSRVMLRYVCYYMLTSSRRPGDIKECSSVIRDGRLAEVLHCMIRQAEKEGLIRRQPEFLAEEMLLTQFAGFCLYLGIRDDVKDISMEQMKEFVYGSIVRALGDGEMIPT